MLPTKTYNNALYIFPLNMQKPASQNIIRILQYLNLKMYFTVLSPNHCLLMMMLPKKSCVVIHKNTSLHYVLLRSKIQMLIHYYVIPLYHFLKVSRNVKSVLILQSLHYPLSLLILSRLLRKKTYLYLGGDQINVLTALRSFLSLRKKVINSWMLLSHKLALCMADRIIFISGKLLENTSYSYLKTMTNKICVAPNFPDKEFHSLFKLKKKIRERPPAIGYVGAFAHYKGFYNFLKAIPAMIGRKPDIQIIIIGDTRTAFPPVIKEIMKSLAKEYPRNIKFQGYIPHKLLPDYLNNIRLLILPSFTEGIPHVILEAMACGTPVLASPVGGVPEIIQDGVTGFLLVNTSPQEIAKKVLELIDNLPVLEKVSMNASSKIKKFKFEKTVQQWKQCLEV